jgi:hypothetical protein
MELTGRQFQLLENAVFLWLTVLPPVSDEVQGELVALLESLTENRSAPGIGNRAAGRAPASTRQESPPNDPVTSTPRVDV